MAAAEFADIRERQRTFEQVAAVRNQNTTLGGECAGASASANTERAVAYVVSPSLFTLLAGHARAWAARSRRLMARAGAATGGARERRDWRRRFGGELR